MRKRIEQIAKGMFDSTKPKLSFSEEQVEFSVIEGRDYTGDFTITSENRIPIRGNVYVTNPRMECLTPQFEGETVRIRYQMKSRGLVEGEKVSGLFVIVCNECEYRLSFSVRITRLYPESSIGMIRNLDDFAQLARTHWSEAYQLFYHNSFSNIIGKNNPKEAMLYEGIVSARQSSQNMEEFLIAVSKKERVEFSIDKDRAMFWGVTQPQKEQFEIRRNSWGYLHLSVQADVEFIRFPKSRIMGEDFLGNSYSLEYMIDPEAMHAGHNYAKIVVSSVYQSYTILLMASREELVNELARKQRPTDHRKSKLCKSELAGQYIRYRLKQTVTGTWAKETIAHLDTLLEYEPEQKIYQLMRAKAFLDNKQYQEAEWILDEYKHSGEERGTPLWGYYLYLKASLKKSKSYTRQVLEKIEDIFEQNPDSTLLFWTLLSLREKYRENSGAKWKAIANWIRKGKALPYLYVEAVLLLQKNPYLLVKFEKFEIDLLRWAIRHEALTRELAYQIFEVASTSRKYEEAVFRLLQAAYELEPTPEHVGVICGYLIKGHRYEQQFFEWYEKGIAYKLRITGLYEAYLLSMDERKIIPVPKLIQMYFQYESSLPYQKLAVLYNNIIAARKKEPEVYLKYQQSMSQFALEQLEEGHMDDNLAVLYDDMLDASSVDEELAHSLADIIYTTKLVVFDPKMVRAIIYQEQMKEPQIVPIIHKAAYFQLYSKQYVILFENEKGHRFAGSVSYRLQKLMDAERFQSRCMELAPDEITFYIAEYEEKQKYFQFAQEDESRLELLLASTQLSDSYRSRLLIEIIRYYRECCKEEEKVEEYLKYLDFEEMECSTRRYMLDLLVERELYEMAYELIMEYGIDQISAASQMKLLCYMLEAVGTDEDEILLRLAEMAFLSGLYNEKTLSYLLLYYNGPTEVMKVIRENALRYGLDTCEMEERILLQMMFVGDNLEAAMEIFAHYEKSGGRELVVLAFLSELSYRYFVQQEKVDILIFDLILSRCARRQEMNHACKLALLKYLSEKTVLSKREYETADALLAEYTCKSIHFAFYKNFPHELVMKYHFYDKVFIEYRAEKESHIVLHYCMDESGGEFESEDMINMYEGIFVKSFVLFFGDVIQYYITVEDESEIAVTESRRIMNPDVYNEKDVCRYNLLNQMLISDILQEDERLLEDMKRFARYDEVTKKIFRLL